MGRLIPMLYSLAHQAYSDGAPISRPFLMEFPSDATAIGITDQWLMGTGLMAAPVLSRGGARTVYFPAGAVWYDFETNVRREGGASQKVTVSWNDVPVFCRAGTVLPLGPVVQHTGQLPGGPLEVHIYAGSNGDFTLVEDDGSTKAYEAGATRRTIFKWDDAAREMTWQVEGNFSDQSIFVDAEFLLFSAGGVHKSGLRKLGSGGSVSFASVNILVL